ncbi:hypothetical protein [Onishia niordana]|uniref:hypothetical protein n=1 Tax=Onishia niordana TaxID=2508711 RepID=UPI0010A01B0E|nr:hypothetical protein [Halomonas niordiana]
MATKLHDPAAELATALAKQRDGFPSNLIELTERAAFPGVIRVQPITARKARCTGILLGRPAPRFVRRGRSISYRLSDLLEWLAYGESYANTAEASMADEDRDE